MKDLISEISNLIRENELALFCAAGISKNSGLPLANELKLHILEQLPIDKGDIDEIMDSNLPFEAFMEILSGHSDISKILDIFKDGEPNTNHILIARLAKRGYLQTIFTTNFDLLIEMALEKEGLKKDKHFDVYYDEEQFSEMDFDNLHRISVFKIHGCARHIDSIRTTLKAIATKSLSDKRMNVINYLFSKGGHKKVLVLGYSCSDVFDITPQIQSIEENQKEVIFVNHSEQTEGIESVNVEDDKNPFRNFSGKRIQYDTQKLIEKLWGSFQRIVGNYEAVRFKGEWKTYVDDWAEELGENKSLKYFIAGRILYAISNFKKAIEYQEKSLEIKRRIGDKAGESRCYTNLGAAFGGLGDFKKAIEYEEKSLKIAKKIGDKAGESRCYTNLGVAFRGLGDFKKAIGYHEKALEINRRIGDKAGESLCYTNLGSAFRDLGDFKKAIGYHEKSLEIKRRIGDKAGESRCYMNLGVAFRGLGDFKKAVEYQEKSLEIKRRIGDKAGESRCYTNLGIGFRDLGDFKKAIEYQEKSLEIKRRIGDKAGESRCYANLGSAFRDLGDCKKAIEYQEKSLEIKRRIGDKAGESLCYTNLGNAYYDLGDFKGAIYSYQKSLEIHQEMEDKPRQSACHTNLGNAYYSLRDFKAATQYYEKSLGIAKETGDKVRESRCYTSLGGAYCGSGDFKRAIEYYLNAENLFKEVRQFDYLKGLYNSLSLAYRKIGDYGNAHKYKKKIGEIELGQQRQSMRKETNWMSTSSNVP